MKKIYKTIPILLASALILGACGKDENDKQKEVITIISEEEMDQEVVGKVRAKTKIVTDALATIILAHPDADFMELPLAVDAKNGEETREQYFRKVVNNAIHNGENAKKTYETLLSEHIKNANIIEKKELDLEYAQFDEEKMVISQHESNLLVELPVHSRFIDKKTGEMTYLNYQFQMILQEVTSGEAEVVSMSFEEGTSEFGEGVITKSKMISSAKDALEFGIENAHGLHYEKVEDIANGFNVYTSNKDVMVTFVENFELNKEIAKVEFNYGELEVVEERVSDGSKDYTQRFVVKGQVEITTSIKGIDDTKETIDFELEMSNLAGEDFISYHYTVTDLKISK